MPEPMKYLKPDPRTRHWAYKREYPRDVGEIDGKKTFVRSTKTSDLVLANRMWSTFDAEYEAKVQQARSLAIYRSSKDKRREKFWLSVARWIEFCRRNSGGKLVLPSGLQVPTATLGPVAFHAFEYVKVSFLSWASDHDRDALEVFRMGDTRLS
jgi:hypothetical protein